MVTARCRRGSRASERGAAVLIVVLVIAMLTTIGLFAARSASLSTAASGHTRQMTQTHYVTEYAMLGTMAELSTEKREAYVKMMTKSTSNADCAALVNEAVSNRTCYKFGFEDLEAQAGADFFEPGSGTTPGSLGAGLVEPDFAVEMTDLGPATPPVAGTDLTSAGAAKISYMSVTLTATGQVRPIPTNGDPTTIDTVSATSASLEASRAHLIVGPLPQF